MTVQEYNEMKKVHQIADEARAHKARAAAAETVTETPAPAVTETAQETKTETAKKEAAPVKTESKPAAPVCSYAPDAVTINGKTFPARYEITETAARIIATVDNGKTAPIVIPAAAPAYAELVKALQAPAAQETETPAPAETVTAQETETPAAATAENHLTETAKKEAAPVKNSKPAAKKAAKKAAAPAVETVTETPAETVTETPAQEAAPAVAVETVTEAAPAAAETVTAQETETPAATAENHLTEADRDPKEARGPIPEKTFAGESISGRGWSIVFDSGLQRTRVIVSDPIKETARPIIENAGFYYSRAMNSWNKKLSFRAYRAAVALADALRAALA